ncbi:MAG: hypothetical protein GY757_42155 [bacterium]|nr:hypothetical protein [bacterium]
MAGIEKTVALTLKSPDAKSKVVGLAFKPPFAKSKVVGLTFKPPFAKSKVVGLTLRPFIAILLLPFHRIVDGMKNIFFPDTI